MPATTKHLTVAAGEGLYIEQGADFSWTITYYSSAAQDTPVNLAGWSARMQIRASHASPDPPTLSLTSVSGITLGGAAGTIVIAITSTQTAALPAPFTGVYDLELVNVGGKVIRLYEGNVQVTPEVTR